MIVHLTIEVSCDYTTEQTDNNMPSFCEYGIKVPGYHCMFNSCPYVAFTDAPYEIAYAGKKGEINMYDEFSWAGFGEDMNPAETDIEITNRLKNIWKKTCVKKIEEAYMEYMKKMREELKKLEK